MEIRETHEHIESAHEHDNKRAALLIVIIAAILAITEMSGKEAQYSALAGNIERSDLYTFYQAKTIRAAIARTAADSAGIATAPAARTDDWEKQVSSWRQSVETSDLDPKSMEGRKELLEKAKGVEVERDASLSKYHDFEFASASLQLAIVMASAAVITELVALELVAVLFGCIGLGLSILGWVAPALLGL